MSSFKPSDVYAIPAWMVRLIVVAMFAGAIALAVWRWNELQLVNRRMNSAIAQESRLVNELQQLEMRWEPAVAAEVEASFQRTLAQLFTGPEEIANWQAAAQRHARANALEHSARLGAAESRVKDDQKLSVIRATLDVEPLSAVTASNSTFRGLLNFTRVIRDLPKRLDLVEIAVTGGSNSIAQAQAVVQLWAREENR